MIRWKDLLWVVQSPPNTIAWLDWATGIVHINVSKPEFDAALDEARSKPRGQLYGAAITHENVHFMQVVTTGYLYRWAFEYFGLLGNGLTDLGYPFAQGEEAKAALLRADEQVSENNIAALRAHAAKLDDPGPYGLTARHLFEAHAMYVEVTTHFTPMSPDAFLDLLDTSAPNRDYRFAFDLARFWLGHGRGFALFPALVMASLCTSSPPEAFFRLLRAVVERDLDPDTPPRELIELLNGLASDILVGSAIEVWASETGEHPVYGPAVQRLNQLAGEDRFNLVEFMSEPVRSIERIADDIVRPTLFRPGEDDRFPLHLPTGAVAKGDEGTAEMTVLLLVSALSTRLHQIAHPEHDETVRTAESLSWLEENNPEVKLLEIGADWLARPELETLTSLFDMSGKSLEDRIKCARAWGGCLLAFPTDDDIVAPRDPAVRRFVRHLHKRLPYLPLYFDFTPGLHAFFTWFGALADSAAWHGPKTLDVTHPSVTALVTEVAQAMVEAGATAGLDAGPQIDRMISVYPQA